MARKRNSLSRFSVPLHLTPQLEIETIQQREGRWVLTDLEGKGRRICDNPTRIRFHLEDLPLTVAQ